MTARTNYAMPGCMNQSLNITALAERIFGGERAALGRGITLVESNRADHEAQAQELLALALPRTGEAVRLGLTGVPGAGKSTTIDTLGGTLTAAGHKVAVLAVDPTSQRTGGSILGDKTRMAKLSVDDNAFIRPSPAGATLGGVARRTRETMVLCEAAGYDIIIVETVGIGQSEAAVAGMVDFFAVLMVAGGGDELQGIKKGVLEIADLIAVNKADGGNVERARRAAADYSGALHIITPSDPNWQPQVITMSGLTNEGLDELWAIVMEHHSVLTASGALDTKRRDQQVRWMWTLLEDRLGQIVKHHPDVGPLLPEITGQVRTGTITATSAVSQIIAALGLSKP